MSKLYREEKSFLLYIGILYILAAAGCLCPEGPFLNIWIFYCYRTILLLLPIISGMLFGYTLKKNRGASGKRILIWSAVILLLYSVLCWLPLFSMHDIFLPTVFWRFRWCIAEGPALLLAASFLLTALLTGRKEKQSASKAPFPFLRASFAFLGYTEALKVSFYAWDFVGNILWLSLWILNRLLIGGSYGTYLYSIRFWWYTQSLAL